MEVLGASFSNLQLAQQRSTLAQSDMNALYPNVPSSYVANFFPQPQNTIPFQTNISVPPQNQACAPNLGSNNHQFSQVCTSVDRPARQSSGIISPAGCHPHNTRNLPSTANEAGVNYLLLLKCSIKL